MKPIFFFYVITILVVSACSSGKSTFEHGNYYDAVITSVSRLRRNNDHKKSIETLRESYPLAITFYEDRANASLASNHEFKWSAVVDAYTAVNTLYDEIKRCPGALTVIPNPVNYFSKLQEARQHAAEENYAAGMVALQLGNREKAKEAYTFFTSANRFVPGYKDVAKKMEEALWAASVKVLVESIPVHSKNVGVSAEFFNDKISEYVHSASVNEFVRFFTRAEAQKIKLNPDHIIQLEFDDFTVGQVFRHEKETQLTKDSIVVGTYVSASANDKANEYSRTTHPSGGGGLVVSAGNGAVVGTPNNSNPSENSNNVEDKIKADKELADKLKTDKEKADKELADKLKADKEKADKELADKLKNDKEKIDKELADKLKTDKEKVDKEKADKLKTDKEKVDKEIADKLKADKEKVDKELAEKLKTDKEKVDKELADKLKADKEKADKEKYIDPTINKDDTTDVKDPVTICHFPPGKEMKHKTLVISRSALKAHLGHGDIEGSCETDKKEQKNGNQEDNKKEKAPVEQGGPDQNEKKDGKVLLYDKEQVFFASSDEDTHKFLSYISSLQAAEADTNKVFATVKATLHYYKKTTTSKGIVSFKIIDAKTGALLSVEKMPGEFVWVSEWATFNGDERALSPEQLKLTQQKEHAPPPPQELFIEFTKPIFNQITSKIGDFYKRY